MKSLINKLAVAIIPLIVLTVTITFSTAIAKKVERGQSAAKVYSQSCTENLSGSYGTMIDTFNAASWR